MLNVLYVSKYQNKHFSSSVVTQSVKTVFYKPQNAHSVKGLKENMILKMMTSTCDIMDAKYIFINGVGKFRTSEDDPLNLELPLFEHKFKIRLYVKNHSSHNAKNCNLSAVATIRI